jgi:hypothetical protein
MLRRWEMSRFADGVTEAQIDELATVLRGCGRYIPELLDSAVGRNTSDADIKLVWEHAYESPEAYARYMRHPYHIAVLDRYLLPDSPEVMTARSSELGLGLVGYETDGAEFRRTSGFRRVVAFRFVDGTRDEDVDAVVGRMRACSKDLPELELSIVARNSMGLELRPHGWTHLWEQAYDDEAAMVRAAAQEAELLAPPVHSSVSVQYRIDAAGPGERPAPGSRTADGPSKPIYLVEQVELRAAEAPEFLLALEEMYLPMTRELGMELMARWQSPPGVGEHVTVMTTFRIGDWGRWNDLRAQLVVDPAMPGWIARKRELILGGRRTFYQEPDLYGG